ncbi:4HBT domain-containing protein [Mycena sanguinolenta]|uniref:4HBT domain-containing protein n=1 Tax=Mycena sanguinolenta TaxID=230812 RepID=A0A8H7D4U6_9AGAR|nr:4HBT domain-containing protein [Mycena sanguinolenta]
MSVLLLGRHAVRRVAPSSSLFSRPLATSNSNFSPRRGLSTFTTISLVSAVSLGAYTLGALYPPSALSLLYPRPAPPPLPPSSPEAAAYVADLESQLQSLPLLRDMRAREDAAEWYETRPAAPTSSPGIPDSVRANNLTLGALRGPGKLALFPLARVKRDESEAVLFVHLGRGLCGHDGIVHGGMLATLLDEALGEKFGVTATLSLKYKAPTRADQARLLFRHSPHLFPSLSFSTRNEMLTIAQFVVIKTHLVELKGRKARVAGTVETLAEEVLVEAECVSSLRPSSCGFPSLRVSLSLGRALYVQGIFTLVFGSELGLRTTFRLAFRFLCSRLIGRSKVDSTSPSRAAVSPIQDGVFAAKLHTSSVPHAYAN